jgi:hypothetical protein
MTSPIDQRVAAIEAMKEAHKILSERRLMSRHDLVQIERVVLALSDLDRGIVGPLTRPAPRARRGRPERNSEEVLLAAASRALDAIFAKEFKSSTADHDVSKVLRDRRYSLGDGSPICAETIRGWRSVKDPRVLRLTDEILANTIGSPAERVKKILRFIAERVTELPPKPRKSRQKRAN